jgi:hypothetical protein
MIKCKLIYYDSSRDISEYKIKSSVNNIEDAKNAIVHVSELTYQDLPPDEDDYEETSIKVKKTSNIDIDWIDEGHISILMKSAELEIEFDDEEQEDRFYDKDWETEWVAPSLTCECNNESTELQYDNGLFTLEIL